jgi:hypothetical protein
MKFIKIPAATVNPKSVIPACFKRESRRVRTWTPDKNIRG